VNTKVIAILVSAIAVGAIGLAFATGALNIPLTSTSSCNTENSNLLAGSFIASQSTPYTYTVEVQNAQSQAVRLTSYILGTQSFSINVAIAAGQNGTFTTIQDANSEIQIPVKTSCGNQFMTTSANPATYTENIAPTSITFQNSTQVTVDLLNNGTATATLTTYYVTDSSGNEYALTNWSGPSIAPNTVTTTTFSIGSSCSQCTLYGSAFTFTSGYQYTIKVATGRGNIFTFTATPTSVHHYSIVLYAGVGGVAQ
jgi:hypothetical protein